MRGREGTGTYEPAKRPAAFGNQLPVLWGNNRQQLANTHWCRVWSTHCFRLQWGLTLLAVWAPVFIPNPKWFSVGNGLRTNRFVHRVCTHIEYKYRHSNVSPLRSSTHTQTPVLASWTDYISVCGLRRTSTKCTVLTIPIAYRHNPLLGAGWWKKGGYILKRGASFKLERET